MRLYMKLKKKKKNRIRILICNMIFKKNIYMRERN